LTFIDQYKRGINLTCVAVYDPAQSFLSEYRTSRREVDDPSGFHAARLQTVPDQLSHLDYEDLRTALARLSPDHREALLLVTAEGLSYRDAAAVCGTAVTIAPGSG
jgi:RNA polymerase sigma-70 factor, ECF subfamily